MFAEFCAASQTGGALGCQIRGWLHLLLSRSCCCHGVAVAMALVHVPRQSCFSPASGAPLQSLAGGGGKTVAERIKEAAERGRVGLGSAPALGAGADRDILHSANWVGVAHSMRGPQQCRPEAQGSRWSAFCLGSYRPCLPLPSSQSAHAVGLCV